MGSVAFLGDDESQPSTSNDGKSGKSSTTLLDGCDAVNRASIPKKLRSAVKKRGRESIKSPLLISRKQNHVSTKVDTLKKDGAKKSKLNMKQGHITKDEKEVAETLYALAGMFSDANKSDQQGLDDEKPEIKSSATLEEGSLINAAQDTCPILQEETREMISKVTLMSHFPSNLVNSTTEEVKSQTIEAPQPEFFSSKKAVAPNASGDQSDLSPGSTSRLLVSILGSNQSREQEIHLDQVTASGVQYGNNCSSIDLSATGAVSSETNKSCLSARIPSLFESTKFSSKPCSIENKITTEKLTGIANKSSKSWKRCSAHVYISRLINVLRISDRKEGLLVQPTTQSTTCGGAELQPPEKSIHNQMPRINGRNGDAYFSAIDHFAAKKDSSETQNDILLHKRPIEDHQMASETSSLCSAKQGYDFLSLGTGIFCGSETSNSTNRAGCFREPPKQIHMPYMQSQNHSMFCSLPQNGYSSSFHVHNSALAAQQVQLAQYNSSMVNSNFTARTGQQTEMEMQQQKWAAQLQTHYNTGGGGMPRFPDWKSGGMDSASVLNYAHSLFPHLHAALGSKYQQLSPSQQQVMAINSSLPLSNTKRHHHNLHLGFERNGGVYHPENMAQLQLQLPCNQKL
ncbi:hypothetical protein C2S52_012631 [Perilla frutescens var. hirtella]|nr:hypothetical protein C2S51_015027 [Perilla frutescens var. frutescens]KAH6775070.1 hypothetical protein C2S52_012631 [Perilla frutescens var. hirtella]